MKLFLTSLLKTRIYSNDDERIPVALDDENGILSELRKSLKRFDRLVVVANDPFDCENNDAKLAEICESLRLTRIIFEESIMLDSRNAPFARELVPNADMIVLTGGKCVCQNEFFNRIGMKDLLKACDGVIIGVSAGAMNLCKTVANFPEELADLSDPRWLDGMGFVDEVIVPHFDGKTLSYQFPCEVDAAKDYILPMSFERDLIGLPNGSFITVDSAGQKNYHGEAYIISAGEVRLVAPDRNSQ